MIDLTKSGNQKRKMKGSINNFRKYHTKGQDYRTQKEKKLYLPPSPFTEEELTQEP